MDQLAQLDAFLLVGGKSSRMGRDKALLEIGGRSLLERAAALLVPLAASVSLVGESPRYAEFGLPMIADRWPGAGPLGGIATALFRARQPWSLVLACDLPFVTGDFLRWLCARAVSDTQNSFDALVPATKQGLEPLCAAYRSSSVRALDQALVRGARKVTDGLAALRVQLVPEIEWRSFSPDASLFRNLNSWQDYLAARSALELR
jgi:molybdenum cofactor guanylyltransferase